MIWLLSQVLECPIFSNLTICFILGKIFEVAGDGSTWIRLAARRNTPLPGMVKKIYPNTRSYKRFQEACEKVREKAYREEEQYKYNHNYMMVASRFHWNGGNPLDMEEELLKYEFYVFGKHTFKGYIRIG